MKRGDDVIASLWGGLGGAIFFHPTKTPFPLLFSGLEVLKKGENPSVGVLLFNLIRFILSYKKR